MKQPLLLATSALAIATAHGYIGNAGGLDTAESKSTTQASETASTPQKASGVGFEMEIGGYFESQLGFTSSDIDGIEVASLPEHVGVDVKRDAEIFFKPSVTLDNGVRIGATVELEAASSGDQIDEAYLSVDGSFGRVLLGSENSARYLMQYAAPDVTFFGVNSGDVSSYVPLSGRIGTFDDRLGVLELGFGSGNTSSPLRTQTFTTSSGTTTDDYGSYDGMTFEEISGLMAGAGELGRIEAGETFPYFDPAGAIAGHNLFRATLGSTYIENMANNDVERITYFSPRLSSGLQFGVSYARDDMEDNNDQVDIDGEELANIVDIGLNYVGTVGPVDLAASGGYGVAFDDADDNPQVWNTGLNLSWQSWTVGGSFAEQNNSVNMDGTAYDAGLAYKNGPWGFSFTYFYGENVDNEYDPDATTRFLILDNLGTALLLREANQDLEGDGKHIGQRGVDEQQEMFLVGLNYDLAKGVRLNAFGGYSRFQEDTGDEGGAGDNADGFVIGTGIRVAF